MHTVSTLPELDDVQEWATLLDGRRQDVWRIVSYALRDPATTEDLVQEVLVAAWCQRADLSPELDPGPWLRSVARNAVRKELRRQLREQRRLAVYQERQLDRLDADDVALDDADDRRRDALAVCRDQLSDPARDALAQRYEEGLDFDEIAARLDRTLAAARQLLTRARATLRDCIDRRLS